MGERLRRRTIYLATIAAMVAMTGGFVMATTISTITAPPPQGGGYTGAGTPPAGVATSSVLISQATGTASASVSSINSPAVLTATSSSALDTYNINAVLGAGDFLETITVTLTAGSPEVAASTEYAISIYINGVTSTPQTLWIETGSSFAAPALDTVSLVYDLGSGSSNVTITSVSDLVTQCPSVGTCT